MVSFSYTHVWVDYQNLDNCCYIFQVDFGQTVVEEIQTQTEKGTKPVSAMYAFSN